MKKELQRFSDYQRFEKNPRLSAMLDAALERAGFSEADEGKLSDDEVDMLNAAGSVVANTESDKEKHL